MWYDYKPERTPDGLKNNKTIYLPFFRLYYSHEWEQLKVETQLTFFIKMKDWGNSPARVNLLLNKSEHIHYRMKNSN